MNKYIRYQEWEHQARFWGTSEEELNFGHVLRRRRTGIRTTDRRQKGKGMQRTMAEWMATEPFAILKAVGSRTL